MKRFFYLTVTALLILSLFTGCGSSSSYEGAMEEEMAPMAQNDALNGNGEPSPQKLPENRKWVITSEVRTETEDLDATLNAVLGKVGELEGYVEDQNFDNGSYYSGYDSDRSARLVIRVPAEQIDAFMTAVEEATNVVSSSRNLKDITLQYTDTETRIAALKAEEKRLLEFMDQAQTMDEILEIERRLTDVHYELENVSSRLRTYDNQVNFATISLYITEVRKFTPVEEPGFLEKITTGFVESVHGVWEGLKNLVILIIVLSPYLVVWGLIILVIVLIVRACSQRSRRKKKAAIKNPQAGKPQEPGPAIPEEWKNFDQATKEDPKKEDKK